MRYYVICDTHSFYSVMEKALRSAGYFDDTAPHRLVILGDLLDRGPEPFKLMNFVLERLDSEELILIRGNHEDLFLNLIGKDHGLPLHHHLVNGTFRTAWTLAGMTGEEALDDPARLCAAAAESELVKRIIPAMRDYYETEHYVFTHGWVPTEESSGGRRVLLPDWRSAGEKAWRDARWTNGMEAARTAPVEGKTVLCGHFHCSYGHARLEGRGEEFGDKADFSPYFAPGVIALDACTALSQRMNVVVLEDTQ